MSRLNFEAVAQAKLAHSPLETPHYSGAFATLFGCIRDALIGSAFELGTVAATDTEFSAGRLGQTALTDCAVGAAFGQFRVSRTFNSFGVGGRRVTNFFEGFTAVGASDALFGEGFSIERAIAGGVFAGGLGELGERFASGLANFATRVRLAQVIPNSVSRNQAGPVFAGVLDRRTGEIFFGLNQDLPPADLHPILRDRLDDWIARGGRQGSHVASAPGGHAEIVALSEALNAQGAQAVSSLQDFVVVTLRTRGAARNTPIPPCDVCRPLTEGTIDGN